MNRRTTKREQRRRTIRKHRQNQQSAHRPPDRHEAQRQLDSRNDWIRLSLPEGDFWVTERVTKALRGLVERGPWDDVAECVDAIYQTSFLDPYPGDLLMPIDDAPYAQQELFLRNLTVPLHFLSLGGTTRYVDTVPVLPYF